MINILNLVSEDSQSTGWIVELQKDEKGHRRAHAKLGGVISDLALEISQADYEQLTIPGAIRQQSMCKLTPKLGDFVLEHATPEDDTTVLLLNFETGYGEVISSIELENFQIVRHEVENQLFRTRFAAILVGVDRNQKTSITINYGFDSGVIQLTEKIAYPPAARPIGPVDIQRSTSRVDKLIRGDLSLSKFQYRH